MFCNKCGKELKNNDKFCSSCGNNIDYNNEEYEKAISNEKTSLVFGIISLVFSFIMAIFCFPLSIIGLVTGINAKKILKRTNAGIILNIIALVFALINLIILVLVIAFFITSDSYTEYDDCNCISQSYSKDYTYKDMSLDLIGTWDCTEGDSENDIQISFFQNNEYIIRKKNNINNDFIKGDFSVTEVYNYNENSDIIKHELNLNEKEGFGNPDLKISRYNILNITRFVTDQEYITLKSTDKEINYQCTNLLKNIENN